MSGLIGCESAALNQWVGGRRKIQTGDISIAQACIYLEYHYWMKFVTFVEQPNQNVWHAIEETAKWTDATEGNPPKKKSGQ